MDKKVHPQPAMTRSRFLICLLLLLACHFTGTGQLFPAKNYPRQYFGWPVNATIGIVANFGELRPNHYHMGLDCRTDQKENMPVVAAADGYIAKVKIEPYGFGRCIYINHPNGFTTLYAHLNAFEPALERYVTEQQYKLQQWSVFLDIPPHLFRVKKGDYIANSGNTGGSQGPHVHFEIRDTKTDKVLNPLLFGMPIPDQVPPDIIRLAVYDRDLSTYEQTPKIFSLKKVNGIYSPAGGVLNIDADKVSFAITSFDRYTGSGNQNGIYEAVLFDNDKAVCGFQLDNVSYDETRYLNAHIDYKTRSNGGPFLQHISRLPGYTNSIYASDGNDGVIGLQHDSTHQVKIEVSDADQNLSTIAFTLHLEGGGAAKAVPANAQQLFRPGYLNVFENNNIAFYLPENATYDLFHFTYRETPGAAGTIYQLHNPAVPLQTYFPVKIKAPFLPADSGMVIKRSYGSKQDFKKATYENGWYKASFREFGNYQLVPDHVPPTVNPVGFRDGMNMSKQRRILFSVSDNTEEIGQFNAFLDGQWLRFTNDKGRNFIYIFDERCAPGEHELKVVVTDQVGNRTEKIFHFTR